MFDFFILHLPGDDDLRIADRRTAPLAAVNGPLPFGEAGSLGLLVADEEEGPH